MDHLLVRIFGRLEAYLILDYKYKLAAEPFSDLLVRVTHFALIDIFSGFYGIFLSFCYYCLVITFFKCNF